ncbi:MAG: hypothetical protein Q4G60_12745 [bacterium]|nr:hypothetical protein [bacterium]
MRLVQSIILCFAVFGFVVYLKGKKKTPSLQETYLERETKANNVRKQPLTDLEYISIPSSFLPLQKNTTDPQLLEYQETITILSEQKIVNLTGISNTDLKLQYGAANLAALTEYDQNFIVLARTLNDWAHRLYELGMTDDAEGVLEFGISCRTDIKAHYLLLASIYKEQFHPERIASLIDAAGSIRSLMKNPIITALTELQELP